MKCERVKEERKIACGICIPRALGIINDKCIASGVNHHHHQPV